MACAKDVTWKSVPALLEWESSNGPAVTDSRFARGKDAERRALSVLNLVFSSYVVSKHGVQ